MAKKHTNYMVLVKYLNGDVEEINYSQDDLDQSNYKAMLGIYKDTKELFAEDCVTIQFCGKSETEDVDIIFQKEIVTADKLIKEEAERLANMSATTALNNLEKAIYDIVRIRNMTCSNVDIHNKRENMLLHQIEKNAKSEVSIKDKVAVYDDLERVRIARRSEKDYNKLIELFEMNLSKKGIKLPIIAEEVKKVINGFDNYINTNKPENLTEEQMLEIEERMIKDVKYRNFAERTNLMKQLGQKYSRVVDSPSKMVITCYNKCR